MYVDKSKTYVGIVEATDDPERLGRCRVRVVDIFDDIPTDDLPWATPWKDLNGNSYNLPDIGKVVTVIFDSGNIYKPEYIYAEHFNVNLEKKLKSLSKGSYQSMKAIVYDEKTQIYSNDDEGLMVDYKFNNMNITGSQIDLNLKDNFGKVNLGDAKADQQAILGTNFMEWFDQFITLFSGESGTTPYQGNLGAPVIQSPKLIEIAKKYQLLRQSSFLSNNVYLNSNFKVSSVLDSKSKRPTISNTGDSYTTPTNFSNYQQTSTPEAQTYSPTEIRPSDSTTKLDTQGSQDLEYGKLVVSDNKTSPTLIVYGGIDVKGRTSGEYMWDYFGGLKNKFNIFVAKNPNVDAIKSYDSTIKYLSANGYNTSDQTLYLFSGGYLPGMTISKSYKDKFNKILLVDIWMGNDNVGNYYTTFVQQNKSKIYYIYTTFGANNKEASNKIAQTAGYAKLKSGGSNDDHMNCNKLSIDILIPEEIKTIPATQPSASTSPINNSDLVRPNENIKYGDENTASSGQSGSEDVIRNGAISETFLKKIKIGGKLGSYQGCSAADDFDRMYEDMIKDGLKPSTQGSYRPYRNQFDIFDWDFFISRGGNPKAVVDPQEYANGVPVARDVYKNRLERCAGKRCKKKNTQGQTAAAFPGTSNHGWGKSIDISGQANKAWIRKNGWKYNWSWYEGKSVNEDWHFTWTTDPKYLKDWG
jgi:LAS superfamily LD-carboxypeptidase LdcB